MLSLLLGNIFRESERETEMTSEGQVPGGAMETNYQQSGTMCTNVYKTGKEARKLLLRHACAALGK